jgi:DNA-binding protein H-NS
VNFTDDNEISVPPAEFSLQVIEHLDLEALQAVAAKAAERLDKVLEETRVHELAMLDSLAKKYGATVTWPKTKKSVRPRPRKPAPVRFIDPANPEKTWTGRGRQPKWLQSYVGQGRAPSEFLVS